MNKKRKGKPDPAILADIVRRVVEAADPEKIILFGSAARGTMGPDSDLDLLVIKGGKFNRHRVRVESRQPLENPGFLAFPQDARLRTWPVDIAKEGPFLPNVGANRHYRKGFPHEAVYPGGHAAGNPGSVRCA